MRHGVKQASFLDRILLAKSLGCWRDDRGLGSQRDANAIGTTDGAVFQSTNTVANEVHLSPTIAAFFLRQNLHRKIDFVGSNVAVKPTRDLLACGL